MRPRGRLRGTSEDGEAARGPKRELARSAIARPLERKGLHCISVSPVSRESVRLNRPSRPCANVREVDNASRAHLGLGMRTPGCVDGALAFCGPAAAARARVDWTTFFVAGPTLSSIGLSVLSSQIWGCQPYATQDVSSVRASLASTQCLRQVARAPASTSRRGRPSGSGSRRR